MKDFQRFWREIRQILDDTAGVRHWNGGIVVPRVGATVVVERDGLIDAVDAKIAKVVPEGVADLDYIVASAPEPVAMRDVCLTVTGARPASDERLAQRVIAGKARVTGVGDGCINGFDRDPHQGVCLRVTGDKAAWNADIARLVKQGSLTVSGPGTHCGPDPAPSSIPPSRAWRKPLEATTGGASTGNDWRSIPTDGRSTSTTTAYPSGATHSIVSRSRRPTLGSTCGCSPGATRTRSAAR